MEEDQLSALADILTLYGGVSAAVFVTWLAFFAVLCLLDFLLYGGWHKLKTDHPPLIIQGLVVDPRPHPTFSNTLGRRSAAITVLALSALFPAYAVVGIALTRGGG